MSHVPCVVVPNDRNHTQDRGADLRAQRRAVAGPVRELPALVAAAGLTYPAIIFIGDVVGLRSGSAAG